MPGLWLPFTTFTIVYLALAATVAALLVRQIRTTNFPPTSTRNSNPNPNPNSNPT